MIAWLLAAAVLLTSNVAQGQCPCDCDGDERVTIAEIVKGLRLALDRETSACVPGCEGGPPCVASLVLCVNAGLYGCPTLPTALATATDAPEPTAAVTTPPADLTPTRTDTPQPTATAVSGSHTPTPPTTPTSTRTPTSCRAVPPRAAPVLSPTGELTQEVFFCGIERGASHVDVGGANTSRDGRRALAAGDCPIGCNGSQACYGQIVELTANKTTRLTVAQNAGICGVILSVTEDVFGDPLSITQVQAAGGP